MNVNVADSQQFDLKQCKNIGPTMRLLHPDYSSSSSFDPVISVHCFAAPDLGAGFEQLFNCLIVQNRQALQSMGEIYGLDIGGQHGGRFVLLRHTHRPPMGPYPVCTSRSGNVRHRFGDGWAGPRLCLGRKVIPVGGCWCRVWKCRVLWGCPSTLHSIGNPPTAPHVWCCQINWWDVVWWVQMGVSIWGAVRLHSMGGWALSGAHV